MNAEELKARALALTHTAIAMRARAEDPTCEVAWRKNKKWFIEKPLWTDGTDYCLAALQQGRVDWTRPVWWGDKPVEIMGYVHSLNVGDRAVHALCQGERRRFDVGDSVLTNDPPKPEPQLRDLTGEELAELVGTAVWWTNDVNKRMRTLITSHDAREVRVWLSNRWVSAEWLRTNATYDREGKLPVAKEVTK